MRLDFLCLDATTMKTHRVIHASRRLAAVIGLAALAPAAWTQTAAPSPASSASSAANAERAQRAAASLANELAAHCPVAAPGSEDALNACKQGLYQQGSVMRASMPDYVLWGRQRDPKLSLRDTNLTRFGPDVFTGLYLPLFMFNGKYSVEFVERERLYRIRLQTAFRNRLAPGQFPYPFWHDNEKWSMYQTANEILLWWDPRKDRVTVAQFTPFGSTPPLVAVEPVAARPFSGDWMWVDAQGRTQPKVTVFDGLFKAENPYIGQLDAAYKVLALRLREGQCNECHVPDNPDKMKRLVLLQTPAHAGAEIKRLLQAVRTDKMPIDDTGIEQPLAASTKAALLRDGEAFDKLYDAAKKWENVAGRKTREASLGATNKTP
jgi:hypothetical protein